MDGSLDLRTRRNVSRNVSELDLLDLQKQGQKLYHQKKFEEALKCFDEAISNDSKVPISVLSSRAATYTKLGKLKPALRDGKRMIEQEKGHSSGYLRTGQILQLMGNISTALDIYQLGLRNVSADDVQLKTLQSTRDELIRRCVPPKAIDPLAILPVELVEMVIGYLSFRQIVSLLRVSKSWKSLLTSVPKLWVKLDLSSTTKQTRIKAVRRYVAYAQQTCSALRISLSSEDQRVSLSHVVSRCKDLQSLSISSGLVTFSLPKSLLLAKSLKTLIISSQVDIYPRLAVEILNQCVNLERAEFHRFMSREYDEFRSLNNLPNLRSLVLECNYSDSSLDMVILSEKVEGIRSLTLRGIHDIINADFSGLQHLEYLDISKSFIASSPKLPVTLRSLIMAETTLHDTGLAGPPEHVLPNLSTLVLRRFASSSLLGLSRWDILKVILPTAGESLQILDLEALPRLSPEVFYPLVDGGVLSNLKELRIGRLAWLDDASVILLAQKLPLLKVLDLSCSHVTGVGVKALLTKLGGTLEWLGLDECHLTSPDAVELARSTGVTVSYRFPEPVKGKGKKVRSY